MNSQLTTHITPILAIAGYINYPKDLFDNLKQDISEKDYYDMFKNITKTYLIK